MDPLTVCGIIKNSNCSHAGMPPPKKKKMNKKFKLMKFT